MGRVITRSALRYPLTLGLRLVVLVPFVPIALMVCLIVAIEEGTRPWTYVLLAIVFGGILAVVLWMHAFLTLRTDDVRSGFMPFFWRTIRYHEIASVAAVDVNPIRDYRGWGVKGRSKQPRGMLFSGGSQRGIRFTLRDGRRYIVTLPGHLDDTVLWLRSRLTQDAFANGHGASFTIVCDGT